MKRISDIPLQDRPREKLQQKGAQSLSDQELLAILLGSGTQGQDVMSVAKRLLKVLDETSANPALEDLTGIDPHNHPAGNVTPSKDDVEITQKLKTAGETLGIRVLDHIIFSHKGYYSFLENDQLR